ncbi:MAG: DUF4333 domain-containing protein [Candidatus Eremiobacteraeota bacterium]|nr:DUF4333 domain-containing protein [Candidatus Eremiobacteraeota bacterium]
MRITAGTFGDNLDVNEVKHTIDTKLGGYLASYDSGLKIGPSRCPDHIDVSGGKTARCTLEVDGGELPIRVVYFGPPQNFKANFDGVFVEMNRVEKLEQEQLLNDYRISAKVHCPGSRVALLKVGATFKCAVEGSPKVSSVAVKVLNDKGMIYTYDPPGLTKDEPFAAPVAAHRQGQRSVVDGRALEHWITTSARILNSVTSTRKHNLSASCPTMVDLSGKNRAVCILSVDEYHVRQAVWIDNVNGIRSRPLDALVDKTYVQRFAQNDINNRLTEHGLQPDAAIDCGTGVIVVTPPATFNCKMTGGGRKFRLEVVVDDASGGFRSHAIPIDDTHRASP